MIDDIVNNFGIPYGIFRDSIGFPISITDIYKDIGVVSFYDGFKLYRNVFKYSNTYVLDHFGKPILYDNKDFISGGDFYDLVIYYNNLYERKKKLDEIFQK